MKIGCVVMASGFSRRFGENKLLHPFRGRPLLWWCLNSLPAHRLERIAVVTRYPALQPLCSDFGVNCLIHNAPALSDTIRLGVEAMKDLDGCVFAVADQPLCRQESLARLLDAFLAAPDLPARLCWEDRPGNPVLFPASYFPALASLEGEQGGGKLLPREVTLVPVSHPAELEDADTPQALSRLEDFLP